MKRAVKTADTKAHAKSATPRRGHAVSVQSNGARKVDVMSVLRTDRGKDTLNRIKQMKKDLSKAG